MRFIAARILSVVEALNYFKKELLGVVLLGMEPRGITELGRPLGTRPTKSTSPRRQLYARKYFGR
jgi:hypothetical protein